MKNKCSIKGSDNCVIQNNEQSSDAGAGDKPTWSGLAVTTLCAFHFLLGCAMYKWVLWRIFP